VADLRFEGPDADGRVLFICTGNVCRSPTAEALLRHGAAERGLEIAVCSGGTLGGGLFVPPELIAVTKPYGLDLSAHASVQVEPEVLLDADLVLGMAREHVREAVLAEPSVFPKTFTLREFVRRAGDVGARPASSSLVCWTHEVHGDRQHRDLLGSAAHDDVADPIGGPQEGYARMVAEVQALVAQLMRLAWP
jgi:protein-tyrosine phosphatase